MHLEIGNAFAKFLEMHFQKLKMHLQNPWKCICKSMEIHGNAFKKPKLEMHFFFPGQPLEFKSVIDCEIRISNHEYPIRYSYARVRISITTDIRPILRETKMVTILI